MRKNILISLVILFTTSGAAFADLTKVEDETQFVQLIAGKTLTRPLIRIQVSENGQISGSGARWPVTGNWSWRDGYFCRDLFWGGDPLGYNCQEVRFRDGRVRFTSDKGRGDSAEFRVK